MNTIDKMKVEIWSDIMCPFCYIGKRKFEKALQQFSGSPEVELVWHSFQLDPSIEAGHGKDLYQYLSERKGIPYAQAVQMHKQLTQTAQEVGLTYNFDNAVVANSFDAHRLIQMAKKFNRGDEAEERLFKAYFTEGKDFSNHEILVELGQEIGLKEADIRQMLAGDEFAHDVDMDIQDARNIGVRGVPFFVFNRKYAVSGAQPSDVFSDVLTKSFTEWKNEKPAQIEVVEGPTCTTDGNCD